MGVASRIPHYLQPQYEEMKTYRYESQSSSLAYLHPRQAAKQTLVDLFTATATTHVQIALGLHGQASATKLTDASRRGKERGGDSNCNC